MTIHILRHGRPLCQFSWDVPGNWPTGHQWVGENDYEMATCGECSRVVNESYTPRRSGLDGWDCPCVQLNEDLGIYDMTGQEGAGRNGLSGGLVAKTYSALKDCPECNGRGYKLRNRNGPDTKVGAPRSRFERI